MDTGLIVIIAIVVLLLLAALVMLPKMRGAARQKQAEREIDHRREETVDLHRREADERQHEADRLEQEAKARRAEAEAHGEHAALHERGLADETLVGDDEQDLARRAGIDRGGENRSEPAREVEVERVREVEVERPRDVEVERVREPESTREVDVDRPSQQPGASRARDIQGGRAHEPAPDERLP